MAKQQQPKSQPAWADVKAKLASLDRADLLSLVHDLYSANSENRLFLHTRFGLVPDVLKPYKQTIERWVAPDVFERGATVSVAKAKRSIADYKKAVGDPAGLAGLMVFYCERASGFCRAYGNDDGGYYNALVRIFDQALLTASKLPDRLQASLIERLDKVRDISHDFGYGVGEDMDRSLAKYHKR